MISQLSQMFRNMPEVVKNLLIINVLIYLTLKLNPSLLETFALHNFGSEYFKPWQVVTHLFVHDLKSLNHLLFNMFNLVFFGYILEKKWGGKRFFMFYFFSALGAIFLSLGINYIEFYYYLGQYSPEEMVDIMIKSKDLIVDESYWTPLVKYYEFNRYTSFGASGAIAGLLVACAYLEPNREINIYGIFPIKFKILIPILLYIDLVLGVSNFHWDNVGHWAHLGGALFGLILVLIWKRDRNNFY